MKPFDIYFSITFFGKGLAISLKNPKIGLMTKMAMLGVHASICACILTHIYCNTGFGFIPAALASEDEALVFILKRESLLKARLFFVGMRIYRCWSNFTPPGKKLTIYTVL